MHSTKFGYYDKKQTFLEGALKITALYQILRSEKVNFGSGSQWQSFKAAVIPTVHLLKACLTASKCVCRIVCSCLFPTEEVVRD